MEAEPRTGKGLFIDRYEDQVDNNKYRSGQRISVSIWDMIENGSANRDKNANSVGRPGTRSRTRNGKSSKNSKASNLER